MQQQEHPTVPLVVVSEVVAIRKRIDLEHQAACYALTAPCITAPHWFISRRMKNIGDCQKHLSTIIGEDASMNIVLNVMENSPAQGRKE